MSGAIYDLTGSYRAAFLNGIAWNLLNMAIAFWLLLGRLRPAPRPREQRDGSAARTGAQGDHRRLPAGHMRKGRAG
jgi:hypothetical protein